MLHVIVRVRERALRILFLRQVVIIKSALNLVLVLLDQGDALFFVIVAVSDFIIILA